MQVTANDGANNTPQDLTVTLVGSGMCLEAGSPEAKGNVVSAGKARAALEELGGN